MVTGKDIPSYSGLRCCRTACTSGGFLPHKTIGIADMLDAGVECGCVWTMCDATEIERSWRGKFCRMFLNIGQFELKIQTNCILILFLYCTSTLSSICLKRLSANLEWV
jgi:hypothetical protein